MRIPLSILLDYLGDFRCENHIPENENRTFSLVSIFPTTQKQLKSDHLYVGRLSQVIASEWRSDGVCCICLRDRIQDNVETEERLKNIIVLNENIDLYDIFNHLQTIFFEIFDWINSMNEYIIHSRSLQDMLQLSEKVLGNFITISDSALGLMAYTPGLECDCPVSSYLVSKGYHSDETIEVFKKYRLPEYWANVTDIYINDTKNVSPYPLACKVVRYNNAYFAHVVMVCNNKAITPGLLDLFKILLEHLKVCFERAWQTNNKNAHVYDSVLTGLLEDKTLSNDIITERAQYAGLPLKANFQVLKITPADESNAVLQRFGQELMEWIPEAKSMLYKMGVFVLLINPNNDEERQTYIIESLSTLLKKHGARCGISDYFSTLTDVRVAYKQADIALRYGKRLDNNTFVPLRSKLPRIYYYDDYYTFHIVCSNEQNVRMEQRSRAGVALERLYQYDQQHDINNLELLYTYLSCDRRTTDTASALHMHRNSVVYRISRIEEIIGMSLDDHGVRFKLLMAYSIFMLYGPSNA